MSNNVKYHPQLDKKACKFENYMLLLYSLDCRFTYDPNQYTS